MTLDNTPPGEYAAMDAQSQMVFLAKLAHTLTIRARGTYDMHGGVEDSVKLRAFNEAQHRISAQLLHLLEGDERRYPDDVFANILIDQCQTLGISPEKVFQWS